MDLQSFDRHSYLNNLSQRLATFHAIVLRCILLSTHNVLYLHTSLRDEYHILTFTSRQIPVATSPRKLNMNFALQRRSRQVQQARSQNQYNGTRSRAR